MTDTEKLKKVILQSGIKYGFLASFLKISRAALWMKINNESEFKASEVAAISALLNLSTAERDEIFFAQNVS